MAARACWLALACALVGEAAAGVKPTVFISADGAPACGLSLCLSGSWLSGTARALYQFVFPSPSLAFSLCACVCACTATVATGGATVDGVTNTGFLTYTFHLSEPSGGTAACTGSPTYTTHSGTMTGTSLCLMCLCVRACGRAGGCLPARLLATCLLV